MRRITGCTTILRMKELSLPCSCQMVWLSHQWQIVLSLLFLYAFTASLSLQYCYSQQHERQSYTAIDIMKQCHTPDQQYLGDNPDQRTKTLPYYQQSIPALCWNSCDIDAITRNGLKYYQTIRNSEVTYECKEKVQHEILDAKSWRLKPL